MKYGVDWTGSGLKFLVCSWLCVLVMTGSIAGSEGVLPATVTDFRDDPVFYWRERGSVSEQGKPELDSIAAYLDRSDYAYHAYYQQFYQGVIAELEGNLQQAEQFYNKSLETPIHEELSYYAHVDLARIFLKRGEPQKAAYHLDAYLDTLAFELVDSYEIDGFRGYSPPEEVLKLMAEDYSYLLEVRKDLRTYLSVASIDPGRSLNLPRYESHVYVTGGNHEILKRACKSDGSVVSQALTHDAEQILLTVLPGIYCASCEKMVSYWGRDAANTADMSVRVIHRIGEATEGSDLLLLAYRCSSRLEPYLDKIFDERLALLTVVDTMSTLRMLPHKGDCAEGMGLSRISVDGEYRIGGGPVVGINFYTSNANPCCDGGSYCAEEITGYYLLGVDGAKQVASVKKHSEERHDSIDSDGEFVNFEISYDASLTFEENADGDLSEIVSTYTITENGEIREESRIKYAWNAQTGMFEEVAE